MDGPSIGRRIRAAQALGGHESVEQLAAAIDSAGLSAKTLRRIVNDKDPRQARPHELREIARACDVPYEFFTEPLSGLVAQPRDDEVLAALAEMKAWEENAVERILAYRTGAFTQVLERLDDIDRRLSGRIQGIEDTLEPIIDLAGQRSVDALASAAEPPARDESARAWDGKDRRRKGQDSGPR